MLVHKPRVWLLGMLAMLLVGSFAAASAEAQGPFWYHRKANSQQIKGVKITGQAPEGVAGGGGEQKLKGKIGTTGFEIAATQFQVKGIIYNNALQAQAKLLLTYVNVHLTNPNFPNCIVTVGTNNTVNVFGHQAWTWNGSSEQLHEQPQVVQRPDWIFTATELAQGATELPETEFTKIAFKGSECGVLLGSFPVKGSVGVEAEPHNLGEWAQIQTQKIIEGKASQHFWNGAANVGVNTLLKLGTEEAKLSGEAQVKILPRQVTQEQQEVALYES